jgi:hypothetical protein
MKGLIMEYETKQEVKSLQTEQSESIGKLAEALSAAQGAMEHAKKDSENPFFKSKYADLAEVWNTCKPVLSKNKLAVIQTTSGTADNVTIITTLAHASGEWIRGKLTLKPVKADPQGVGSAITYGRRYSLAAIVGVSQDDDDGNAASGNKPDNKPDNKPQTKPANAKKPEPEADWIKAVKASPEHTMMFKDAGMTTKDGAALWDKTDKDADFGKRAEQFYILIDEEHQAIKAQKESEE